MTTKLATQRAFTLIEVIVALTIFGLITASLYGVFFLSHRAVEKAQARSAESVTLSGMEDFFGSYIRAAYPYKIAPEVVGIFFAGEESRLSFVTASSVGMGGRGMARITVSRGGDEGVAGNLTVEEQTPVRFGDQGGGGVSNSVVILRGVKNLKIEYLSPQTNSEAGADDWQEDWDGADKGVLPKAVRLNIRSERGDEIQWVFPIMMQVMTPR